MPSLLDDWRQNVIAEARSWLGTPYQHKGRVKGVGVDCGGLLYQVYSPIIPGLKPFPKDYAPDWALHKEQEIYLDFIAPYTVPSTKAVPGGMALFRVGRNFSHGAIVTEALTFVHAWGRNGQGLVQESRRMFFGNRPVRFFDVKCSS